MVEAFRLALKRSAEAAVAEEAGPDGPEPIRVLDIERLLATPPDADAAMRKRGSATEEGVW
jgi:hypothetical protein